MVEGRRSKVLSPPPSRWPVGLLGLMLAVSLAAGALALWQVTEARAQLDQIVQDNIIKIKLNHQMSEAVHVVSRVVPELVLLSDPADIEGHEVEVARARAQYDTAWAALQALPVTESGRTKRAAILDASLRVRRLNDEVIGLARANRDDLALALLRDQAVPAAMEWQRAIDDKIENEETDNGVHYAVARVIFGRSMALMAGVSLLTLAAALLVAWLAARQTRKDKLAQADLERALAAAEGADRAKSMFLANLSHEIRTPMSGVLGVAEVLGHTSLDETQRKYVRTIRQSGRSLLALLNDILDLSKVESGRLDLEQRPTDLRRLLQASIDLVQPGAAKKGLDLALDIPDEMDTWVTCDPLRLQQVINNLLGNAIKFSDKGHVRLSVRSESASGPSALRFCVQDSGPGIKPQAIENLFQPFSQADGSTARKYGGSGLGLAIAKRLVQVMGGTLTLESEPDVGSRFCFTVSLLPAPPALRHPDAPESGFADLGNHALDDGRLALSVLLVEDNPVNQMIAQVLLEQMGHKVQIASDGLEAVRLAGERPYDLILMDCHLPTLDGIEATRRIRQIEARGGRDRQTIVALTATASDEDRRRCRDAGMDEVVLKPFTAAELARVLARMAPAN